MSPGKRVKGWHNGKVFEMTIASLGKPFRVRGGFRVYEYMVGDGHTHHIGEPLSTMGLLK
jgi:hypothetical protein